MGNHTARWPRSGAIRWPPHDYASGGVYFVTICAHERQLIFEDALIADVIGRTWFAVPIHFPQVSLDAFVVMPNHFHGILLIEPAPDAVGPRHASALRRGGVPSGSLGAIIGSFKSSVTREVRTQGLWDDGRFWQPNYHDRVIRNDAELNRIREYIAYNPVAWQYDAENPARVADLGYEQDWGWLELTAPAVQ